MNLLVCHGDEDALKSLEIMLGSRRFNVYGSGMGEEAFELGVLYDYDAIVLGDTLDITADGVIKSLRDRKIKTPILVLSENADPAAIVRSLDLGADDYISMPFAADELVARLTAVVRRSKGHARSLIKLGTSAGVATLDMNEKRVEIDGEQAHLTGKEYALLEMLALRQGNVQTKEAILNHIYGGLDEPEIKIIDVFICKLRKKLPLDLIQTVWGRGYLIAKPVNAEPAIGKDARMRPAGYARETTHAHLTEHELREVVG